MPFMVPIDRPQRSHARPGRLGKSDLAESRFFFSDLRGSEMWKKTHIGTGDLNYIYNIYLKIMSYNKL
jgi:hypothetical protein